MEFSLRILKEISEQTTMKTIVENLWETGNGIPEGIPQRILEPMEYMNEIKMESLETSPRITEEIIDGIPIDVAGGLSLYDFKVLWKSDRWVKLWEYEINLKLLGTFKTFTKSNHFWNWFLAFLQEYL